VGAPAAIGAGSVLLTVGLIDGRTGTHVSGAITLFLGIWIEIQRRRDRPQPLLLLALASIGVSIAVFFGDRTAVVGVLPVYSLLTFVGLFTLARPVAVRFAVWCCMLAVVSATKLIPDPVGLEIPMVVVSMVTTFGAGFWLISRADDTLADEERDLTEALGAKDRLLGYEQAIATCSQALLGNAANPVPIALEALRAALDAETVYLCVNVDDPAMGPSFEIVDSSAEAAVKARHSGVRRPWSEWPEAHQLLSRGSAYRYRDDQGRDLMGVPVFDGDVWIGALGLRGSDPGDWSAEAVKLLSTAAPLLATYWERESTRLRLEDLVRSKDRFLASVSHEIRTPLSAVLGFAELLKSSDTSHTRDELTEILGLIAAESQDMADMIEDLLVGARAEMGTVSVHAETVYLRSQAEAAVVGLRSLSNKKIDVIGGPGKAWADPGSDRFCATFLPTPSATAATR
jgi:GAF domain-containing protein